ncbi:MAG: nucleoside deaminase [Saprospiraceae bacterium]|nr:nucleoside deaminase [Saprospiraceae bacterium]
MSQYERDLFFIRKCIALARYGMEHQAGGPFGALVVHDGVIIGQGMNRVTSTNDPTAHAEVVAIREACAHRAHYQLEGCTIYTSCEPCPMCLGAIYWARPVRLVYAANRKDAAEAGFADSFIYDELRHSPDHRSLVTMAVGREEALSLFSTWKDKEDKLLY